MGSHASFRILREFLHKRLRLGNEVAKGKTFRRMRKAAAMPAERFFHAILMLLPADFALFAIPHLETQHVLMYILKNANVRKSKTKRDLEDAKHDGEAAEYDSDQERKAGRVGE